MALQRCVGFVVDQDKPAIDYYALQGEWKDTKEGDPHAVIFFCCRYKEVVMIIPDSEHFPGLFNQLPDLHTAKHMDPVTGLTVGKVFGPTPLSQEQMVYLDVCPESCEKCLVMEIPNPLKISIREILENK